MNSAPKSFSRIRCAGWTATVVAALAILAHNSATIETYDPTNPNAAYGVIEYGWPIACMRGRIFTEQIFYATLPRQHWAATRDCRPILHGLIGNVLLASLLLFATYGATVWCLRSFHAKLSIATLLGLMAFSGLLFAHEIADNAGLVELFPHLKDLFLEHHIFEYIEKLVWLTIFVACLWWPNATFRVLRRPK